MGDPPRPDAAPTPDAPGALFATIAAQARELEEARRALVVALDALGKSGYHSAERLRTISDELEEARRLHPALREVLARLDGDSWASVAVEDYLLQYDATFQAANPLSARAARAPATTETTST